MSTTSNSHRAQDIAGRGQAWLDALSGRAVRSGGYPRSVQVADVELWGRGTRLIAVVPDPDNPFPRARNGEVGLLEGWSLARAVHEVIDADRNASVKRAIVAIVDTPSQAYGRREEALGIHQALASAAAAYATARLQGHPVIALLVGKAMSGAFLAHGYQANRILALADPGVQVHAMGKEAAARITLRSVEELEAFAATVPPMAYDIDNYASLGLLWRTIAVENAASPTAGDVEVVMRHLHDALADIDADPQCDLRSRQHGEHRGATRRVRALLASQWRD